MKSMMTIAAALLAAVACAQEFGSEAPATAAPVGQGTGAQAVVEAQESDPEPAPTAKQMVEEWLDGKEGLTMGYDEGANRIIVVESIDFDVKDPRVSAKFVEERTERMSELLLKAKASIIETIMSKMSASRVLDIPGNPIAKQLAKEQAELNREMKAAGEDLAQMSEELEAALKHRDTMTSNEIFSVISSWFTRTDKENLAEKYTGEKKEQYEAARKAFLEAKKRHEELLVKAEALKGQISKELKTSITRVSEMPIYGCTILQQAESFTKKASGKYTCQLAIVYAWSMEMQTAAGEILKGESVKFTPGKRSIKEWLKAKVAKGALSQWCGPRQYIDDKGNMWFLGIACTPVMDDADDNNNASEEADLAAAAEVMFSLYADASSSKTLEKLMQTRVGANGEKETEVLKDFHKTQRESFENIQVSGNSKLYSNRVRHQASGLDLNVSVYGISSGSAKALKAIQSSAVALGIEVNTAQEVERGRQEELKRSFEASKTNAAARAMGAEKAKKELADEAAKAKARREQRKRQAETFKESKSNASGDGKTKGQLRAGASFIEDDDE